MDIVDLHSDDGIYNVDPQILQTGDTTFLKSQLRYMQSAEETDRNRIYPCGDCASTTRAAMSSSKKGTTKRFKFDESDAVTEMDSVSSAKMQEAGGPALLGSEEERNARRAAHGERTSSTGNGQSLDEKRREKNRKSNKVAGEGRKAYSRSMEDSNTLLSVQNHSLERTITKIDNESTELEGSLSCTQKKRS